jgi:hypothetical protein
MRSQNISRIGLSCLAFMCFGVALAGDLNAAEIEPYEARVTTPRALVLSGPGEKYYPTGTLSPGEIVEVYRDAGDGWLGIRPPKGSFSLVSEKELSARNGDVAEISGHDVSSRIGSQLSDKCNAVQVRLKKGEVVEVLGKESADGETWFKIAPPAGEFRWIHAASVERRGPISEGAAPAEDDAQVIPAAATSSESDVAESKANTTTTTAQEAPNAPASENAWQASTTPVATPMPAAPPLPQPAPPLEPVAPSPTQSTAPAKSPTPPNSPVSAEAAPKTPAGFDLPRQLTDIEMRLSRMASAPPQLWNTERLQRDAEQLLAQAKTQPERDAVKATMGKIDQFTTLARRYQQGGQAVSRQPSAISPMLADSRQPTADSRYDAVGILRPVVSKRPGAPQFALVDERGQVVTFVTPTPDVNLQAYLGRRVGIAGNRGFIPEFNRAHVTAGRVTPLMR